MKNTVIIVVLLIGIMTTLSAIAWENSLPIRQGANIEWFRSSASLNEGVVYAWSDTRDGARDLYAQCIGSDGQKLWGENGLLVDSKPDRQEDPVVIGTSDNCAIIAWVDFSSDPDGDIYAQKINASGQKLWDENGVPLCLAIKVQISLNIVPDTSGGAFVIWNDSRSIGKDIYGQHISGSGQPLWQTDGIRIGVEFGNEEQHTFWEDGQGGAMIAYIYRSDQSVVDIHYARINSDGTFAWGPMPLTNDPVDQVNVRIIPDDQNGFILAWDQEAGTPSNSEIFVQRINLSGQKLWGENGINLTNNPLTQERPRLAQATNGAWIVWEDKRFGSNTTSDIFLQKVDINGQPMIANGGLALCEQPENQVQARISSADNGSCVVVWEDGRNNGDIEKDIFAQKVDATGTIVWEDQGRQVCTAEGKQEGASVKFTNNKVFFVWADSRSGSLGLYQQMYDLTNNPIFAVNGEIVYWGLSGNAENLQLLAKDGFSYIFWDDTRMGEKQIYFQKVNEAGEILLEQNGITISQSTNTKDRSKAILDPDGNIIIVWMERINSSYFPKAQKISPTGELLWGVNGLDLSLDASLNNNQKMEVVFIENAYYFYWNDTAGSFGVGTIKGQKVVNNAKMWGENGRFIVNKSVEEFSPENIETILNDVVDNYIVWSEYTYETGYNLMMLKVNEDGSPATGWNANGVVVSNAINDQKAPQIVNTPDGIVVLWVDLRNENNSSDLYAQVFNTAGVPQMAANGVPIVEVINSQDEFKAVYGNGHLNLVWKDFRNDGENNYDVYAQRLTISGANLVSSWANNGVQLTLSDSAQVSPDVVMMNDRCLVVWEDAYYDHNIRMGMIESNGTVMNVLDSQDISANVTDHIKTQRNPLIGKIDDVEAFVGWVDGISSGKEEILGIYLTKISTATFTSNHDVSLTPLPLAVKQNYPNPFNPVTNIEFSLKNRDRVMVDIYNIKGQKVKSLMNDIFDQGNHKVTWNGVDNQNRPVSSGVYYYRVQSGNHVTTKKMVLLK